MPMDRERQYGESMASRDLDIFKERYDKDQNPIWLMNAYLTAHKYSLSIPEWVQNRLRTAFQEYLDGKGNITLDIAFGLKTTGRGTAFTAYDQLGRDVQLYPAIDLLRRKGMRVTDAVSVAHSHFSQLSPPNEEKIRQTYYSKWKAILAKVIKFPEDEISELLYSAPKEIRNKHKYSQLFETYAPLRKVPSELREFLIEHDLLEDLQYLERTPSEVLPKINLP